MEQFIQDNMKVIRTILGYTQADLANLLGVSRVHYVQIEGGKIKLGRTVAIAFMTIIIHIFESIDEDDIKYELLNRYIKEFRYYILNLVERA